MFKNISKKTRFQIEVVIGCVGLALIGVRYCNLDYLQDSLRFPASLLGIQLFFQTPIYLISLVGILKWKKWAMYLFVGFITLFIPVIPLTYITIYMLKQQLPFHLAFFATFTRGAAAFGLVIIIVAVLVWFHHMKDKWEYFH